MGRKKGYDRDALVTTALGVFHSCGYKGASTEVLVQELGVNRNSMYSEFGSKEGLFAATLDHYDKLVVSQIFGALELSAANLDDIEALYHSFSGSAKKSNGLGCLMCNTAAELGGAEQNLQPLVEHYFDRLHKAFSNALGGAIRCGQVAANISIEAEARFLTSCCIGIFIMVRAGIVRPAAHQAVEGALNHLRMLRQASR